MGQGLGLFTDSGQGQDQPGLQRLGPGMIGGGGPEVRQRLLRHTGLQRGVGQGLNRGDPFLLQGGEQLVGTHFRIQAGPDRALWFGCGIADEIGRITTGGSITYYPIPSHPGGDFVESIASGPGGALSFTESSASRIGRISTR